MDVFERWLHMGIRLRFYRSKCLKLAQSKVWAGVCGQRIHPNQAWPTPCIYPGLSSDYFLCIIDVISCVIFFVLTA